MRYTAAHVLAQAVLALYSDAKLDIGLPIENGFYYDFRISWSLSRGWLLVTGMKTAVLNRQVRVEVNESDEHMNKKIRQAQLQKVPYMLIVGDHEETLGTVSVRTRLNEDRGPVPLAEFQAQIIDSANNRLATL